MNANPVVPREMQRECGLEVSQLFAESVRETRKSAHRHAHGQILALNVRRADLLGVAIAELWLKVVERKIARSLRAESADADIEMTRRKAFPAILRLRDRSYRKPIE
jgi:hypothetical protein